MKTTARLRAAHVPPHRLNRIKLAMSLTAATPQTVPTAPVEPASRVGSHFAGLLKTNRVIEMAAPIKVAEAHIDSVDDDFQYEKPSRGLDDRDALRVITSKRLLAARLMNGYSQTEAAELLRYGTPAQLSQWEQCRRQAPLHMMLRASEVYATSMDYLTGVSDDPERDVRAVRRNATVRAVRATLVHAVERAIAAMDSSEGVLGPNVATLRELVAAAEAVNATYGDFVQQRHAEHFARRLALAVENLESASLKAGITLRRHDDESARAKQRFAEAAANDGS